MNDRNNGALRAGRPPSQRQLRVGEEIRHILAELFRRGDFRDPELAELNITVTEVRVSPDLRAATVFFTPFGGGGTAAEALAVLKRAAPFLRGQIARSMKLRVAPTIGFEPDTSFDYAGHIATILHSPDVARDLLPRDDAAEDTDEDDDGTKDAPRGS